MKCTARSICRSNRCRNRCRASLRCAGLTGAKQDVSWPPIVLPEAIDPADADIYADMRGRPANVISALSLVPDNVRWLNDQFAAHYLSWPQMGEIDKNHRTLTRPQLELLATRVSALNECFY